MTLVKKLVPVLLPVLVGVMLSGCRGGDEDTGEITFPSTPNPDAFAAFLNTEPGVPRDETVSDDVNNIDDFPEAYYNSIDPLSTRDTLQKWLLANGFTDANGDRTACELPDCATTHVKFRDTKDLGYGRNMFMRWNKLTGDVAVYVENFQVDAVTGIPYGPLNFEALVNDDRSWNFGVNAIEFSAYPQEEDGAAQFTKFYNFSGQGKRALLASGSQQHVVDLDGRGLKPMPTPCIVCHGGHGRTLVVRDEQQELILAPTILGGVPGDVQANMQMIELDTLQFANTPGFTREDNEDGIRLINEAIRSTFQARKDALAANGRRGEWDPDFALELMDGRYNGDVANSANAFDGEFIPTGWNGDARASSIYNTLIGPNCIVCHALRGSQLNASSIAFTDLTDFSNFGERIDELVFEHGLMPLGLLNYSDFWESRDKNPANLATLIGHGERVGADNRAIKPGKPVAVIAAPLVAAGLDAAGNSLDIPISAAGSAFAAAGSYRWTVSPEQGASITLTDQDFGAANLNVSSAGQYTVFLEIDGSVIAETASSSQVIDVQVATATLPSANDITFFGDEGIDSILSGTCIACHESNAVINPGIPVSYEVCNPVGMAGGDAAGYSFLYRSVLARVNFNAPLSSLIVRKPTNGATDLTARTQTSISNYHGGGLMLNDDESISKLMTWILAGAPRGDLPTTAIPAGNGSCL